MLYFLLSLAALLLALNLYASRLVLASELSERPEKRRQLASGPDCAPGDPGCE